MTFLAKFLRQTRDGSRWAILFFEQSGRSVNYDMSGNGKEFEVMGFVKQCLMELVTKHNPQCLVFSSQTTKNDSRSGAYDRIITRYLSSKYDVTKWSDDTETNFTLTRKQ